MSLESVELSVENEYSIFVQECPIRATQWTSNQSSFRIINPELDFNEAEPFGLYEQQVQNKLEPAEIIH